MFILHQKSKMLINVEQIEHVFVHWMVKSHRVTQSSEEDPHIINCGAVNFSSVCNNLREQTVHSHTFPLFQCRNDCTQLC